MREWIEELSVWMETQEKIPSSIVDLEEEICQATLETDSLLEAYSKLETAYSAVMQKIDHVRS